MIGQLKTLLKVKSLKEDQALREANAKREAVRKAAEATERARASVRESERTLRDREDAIYNRILGKVVGLDAIDETKGRVIQLEKDHGALVDVQERAIHVEARTQTELEAAKEQHRKAVRDRDKYILLTEDAAKVLAAQDLYKEESEIEELFSTGRRGLSWR